MDTLTLYSRTSRPRRALAFAPGGYIVIYGRFPTVLVLARTRTRASRSAQTGPRKWRDFLILHARCCLGSFAIPASRRLTKVGPFQLFGGVLLRLLYYTYYRPQLAGIPAVKRAAKMLEIRPGIYASNSSMAVILLFLFLLDPHRADLGDLRPARDPTGHRLPGDSRRRRHPAMRPRQHQPVRPKVVRICLCLPSIGSSISSSLFVVLEYGIETTFIHLLLLL